MLSLQTTNINFIVLVWLDWDSSPRSTTFDVSTLIITPQMWFFVYCIWCNKRILINWTFGKRYELWTIPFKVYGSWYWSSISDIFRSIVTVKYIVGGKRWQLWSIIVNSPLKHMPWVGVSKPEHLRMGIGIRTRVCCAWPVIRSQWHQLLGQ